MIIKNYDSKIKLYVFLGVGYYKYEFDNDLGCVGCGFKEEGILGNVGFGVFWCLNDVLFLCIEVCVIYNIDEDFWNYIVFVGFNVVFGGYLKFVVLVVEVVLVELVVLV